MRFFSTAPLNFFPTQNGKEPDGKAVFSLVPSVSSQSWVLCLHRCYQDFSGVELLSSSIPWIDAFSARMAVWDFAEDQLSIRTERMSRVASSCAVVITVRTHCSKLQNESLSDWGLLSRTTMTIFDAHETTSG